MQAPSRQENVPISFFAMVMGLSGLTVAWEKIQRVFYTILYMSPLLGGNHRHGT